MNICCLFLSFFFFFFSLSLKTLLSPSPKSLLVAISLSLSSTPSNNNKYKLLIFQCAKLNFNGAFSLFVFFKLIFIFENDAYSICVITVY